MPAYLDTLINEECVPDINNNLAPIDELNKLANKWKLNIFTEEFSNQLDNSNLWPNLRNKFCYPKLKDLSKGYDLIIIIIIDFLKLRNKS